MKSRVPVFTEILQSNSVRNVFCEVYGRRCDKMLRGKTCVGQICIQKVLEVCHQTDADTLGDKELVDYSWVQMVLILSL